MKIPDKLIAYRAYKDGKDLLGIADVELPEIEMMSDTIKGAGISGEVDLPTLGHIGAMSMTINWRTVNPNLVALSVPIAHALDFRASQQVFDNVAGRLKTVAVKHIVRAIPKKITPGKMETGATTDSGNEFSVIYYKIVVDGKVAVEIDPFNYIYIIDGIDYLSEVRKDLGL
ncbi:MAG: phage major tail tube protein [Cellulosilyticaceae bacterium]